MTTSAPSKMFKGNTVLVVGAGGNIGSELCVEFDKVGLNVVLVGRKASALQATAQKLHQERCLVASADATDVIEIEEVFAKAIARFGGIDAVVLCAGTWDRVSLETGEEEALSKFETHMMAFAKIPFVVGRKAANFFRDQGHGLIVNMSSHAAIRSDLKGNLTYAMFKAAGHHFILNLRNELGDSGVLVTNIAPAIVNTEKNADWLDTEEKRAKAVQPKDIARYILENFDNPDLPAVEEFKSSVLVA